MEDYLELAAHILGIDDEQAERGSARWIRLIDERLVERWGIDIPVFQEIAAEMIRLSPAMRSPLDGALMRTLGYSDELGWYALARVQAE